VFKQSKPNTAQTAKVIYNYKYLGNLPINHVHRANQKIVCVFLSNPSLNFDGSCISIGKHHQGYNHIALTYDRDFKFALFN